MQQSSFASLPFVTGYTLYDRDSYNNRTPRWRRQDPSFGRIVNRDWRGKYGHIATPMTLTQKFEVAENPV